MGRHFLAPEGGTAVRAHRLRPGFWVPRPAPAEPKALLVPQVRARAFYVIGLAASICAALCRAVLLSMLFKAG